MYDALLFLIVLAILLSFGRMLMPIVLIGILGIILLGGAQNANAAEPNEISWSLINAEVPLDHSSVVYTYVDKNNVTYDKSSKQVIVGVRIAVTPLQSKEVLVEVKQLLIFDAVACTGVSPARFAYIDPIVGTETYGTTSRAFVGDRVGLHGADLITPDAMSAARVIMHACITEWHSAE